MRAQKPGQWPHPYVSGHQGTERLLPQERRGEPCPCPLPGMLRAQDLGEVGCPASIGPLNAPSGSLAPGGGNFPLLRAKRTPQLRRQERRQGCTCLHWGNLAGDSRLPDTHPCHAGDHLWCLL